MEILCFYAGFAFVYLHRVYPLLLLGFVLFFRPRVSSVLWFLAALLWGIMHQYSVSDWGMPHEPIIQRVNLTGTIASIPNITPDRVQFHLAAATLNHLPVSALIAMSCYQHCPEVHVGERWQLTAKLKKPQNLGNPGRFDYAGLLQSRHINWAGTIQRGPLVRIEPANNQITFLKLRETLATKLRGLLPDQTTLGLVQALSLGITNHIDASNWDLFRRTGTVHLIDISGSHISLIAGLAFGLVRWVWPRLGSLSLYWPAQRAASLFALCIAALYTAIAGFAVPAQRALFSGGVLLWRYCCSQPFSIWQAWGYALLLVLIIEPHAVMMIGFYLSFFGIAILILTHQRFPLRGPRKLLVLQLACLIGLMPLSLYWFSYGAFNGLLANMIAIPLVELWIVPLALLITFLPQWALLPGMIWLLHSSIHLFMGFLHWVDAFAFLNISLSFHQIRSPLALMLALGILLLLPLRAYAFPTGIMVLMAFFPSYPMVKPHQARIDVLDVGQGLSVVVQTAHHVLIYDTGMAFYKGFDMGKMALIPYLNTLGVQQLDTVVISHPDLDHRGGLTSLEARFPIQSLLVNEPNFYHRGFNCHQYPAWEWDGVSFRFLPLHNSSRKKNDHSCVLHISTGKNQALLTGDIEKPAEMELVEEYGQRLKSSVLIIPHHASRTSSSPLFVSHISPQYAIVSYGLGNRYHFPHTQAMHVYQQQGVPVFNTADCGMVSVTLASEDRLAQPRCYRFN